MKNITLAGMLAGLIGSAVNLIARRLLQTLGIAEQSFHYIGQLLHLHTGSASITGTYSSVLAHIGIGIISGIIFAHYIHKTTLKNILYKGAFFTSSLWLILLGLGTLFKFPGVTIITPLSAFLIYINLVVFGIVKATVIRKLFHIPKTVHRQSKY